MDQIVLYRQQFVDWFLSLGTNYGVNPLVFGAIYVGAIPLFALCVGRIIRNYRQGDSIVLPSIFAACCFVSSYVYVILVGKNVPAWVYGCIVVLLAVGVRSTWKKIRQGVRNGSGGK